MANKYMKLHVLSFGLALGIIQGVFMFLLGILAWLGGVGKELVTALAGFYMGYSPTFGGAIVGLILGFLDFFVFGVIASWLYNSFSSCCCKNETCKECTDKPT